MHFPTSKPYLALFSEAMVLLLGIFLRQAWVLDLMDLWHLFLVRVKHWRMYQSLWQKSWGAILLIFFFHLITEMDLGLAKVSGVKTRRMPKPRMYLLPFFHVTFRSLEMPLIFVLVNELLTGLGSR